MTRAADDARRLLRDHTAAVVSADGRLEPALYVVDDATGRPVMPLPPALVTADEIVLFIPEESAAALQLLVLAERIDPDAATDRWEAYHGRPRHPAWFRFAVDAARLGSHVADGAEVTVPHPFAADQPALCARANRRRDRFDRLAPAAADDPGAAVVGVDPWGLHVRARRRVVRVAFQEPATSAAQAAARLDGLLGQD